MIEIYVRLMNICESQIKGIYIRENSALMCKEWGKPVQNPLNPPSVPLE